MKKEIKELVIDRSHWLVKEEHRATEGENAGSAQLHYNGRMCCLGFLVKKAGVSKKAMGFCAMPSDLKDHSTLPSYLFADTFGCVVDSDWTDKASRINDDQDMTVPQKEKALKEHFKKVGIKLKFVGRLNGDKS